MANADDIKLAAEWIEGADALLIGAGAGMGVDSGLPDFRGNKGFWKAYPIAKQQGKSFSQMANPRLFKQNPRLAWGFYGHRLNLYKKTEPHAGFQVLKTWCDSKPLGGFVYTSNVDGHFQKAGFSDQQVYECHGSIHYLQCADGCCNHLWAVDEEIIEIDEQRLELISRLPLCEACGAVARPNILMFGDIHWEAHRSSEQESLWYDWLQSTKRKDLVVIEIGAGIAVPTVRNACSRLGKKLIRINPEHTKVEGRGISFSMGGLEAIVRIRDALR
tara:strand:+ start:4495 stop:5316 length:822 start_codon:yes stop_codon:yes gene_type:complete